MMAGAASVAPCCKVDGCSHTVRSRGMCSKHYQSWMRKNPNARVQVVNRKLVLDCLPARWDQIVADTGLTEQCVKRHLDCLFADLEAHIGAWDDPDTTGTKWLPRWVEGPGEHAKLTKAMRKKHSLKIARRGHASRRQRRFGWAGAIGMRALGPRA